MIHAWIDIIINLSSLPLTILAVFAYSPEDISRRYSHFHTCRSTMLIAVLNGLPNDISPLSSQYTSRCCGHECQASDNSIVIQETAVEEVAVRIRAHTPTGQKWRVETPKSRTPINLFIRHFTNT